MNGPQHYLAAERELEAAQEYAERLDSFAAEHCRVMAEIHATLALAAAHIDIARHSLPMETARRAAWDEATS